MSFSQIEIGQEHATALHLKIRNDNLHIELTDGRVLEVPLEWYPRLYHGTQSEQENFRFLGRGEGIHWPDLDEDIAVVDLLAGNSSGESHSSFKKWLSERTQNRVS